MSHQIPHANIGKKGLLDWLNDFYHFNYTKIEECASGAALCQILDSLYPGTVPLAKVNFNAKRTSSLHALWKSPAPACSLVTGALVLSCLTILASALDQSEMFVSMTDMLTLYFSSSGARVYRKLQGLPNRPVGTRY